jgi:hypothetical protein
MVDINTVMTKTASDVYTRANTEHTCIETSWAGHSQDTPQRWRPHLSFTFPLDNRLRPKANNKRQTQSITTLSVPRYCTHHHAHHPVPSPSLPEHTHRTASPHTPPTLSNLTTRAAILLPSHSSGVPTYLAAAVSSPVRLHARLQVA